MREITAVPAREALKQICRRRKARAMPLLAPVTIAWLAEQSGVDAECIRTYQEAGLLPQLRRLWSRKADAAYRRRLLEQLTFLWRARKLGFSLDAIGSLLGLKGGLRTSGDIRRLTERHLAEVRARGSAEEISLIESALVPLMDVGSQSGGAKDIVTRHIDQVDRPQACARQLTFEGLFRQWVRRHRCKNKRQEPKNAYGLHWVLDCARGGAQ